MTDQILQNTTDKIEIDIYYNNVLTNPTSVIIRDISDPNGNIILTNQPVVQGLTTGRYEYSVNSSHTATLGIYTAIWQFIINNTTFEHTQNFEVVSIIHEGYISPYEVRNLSVYDKITDDYPTDKILQRYIDRSTDIIDTYLGGSIDYAIYNEKRRCVLDKVHNGVHIQLAHRPIIDLTSVQLDQGYPNTVDLDTSYVRINKESGYLEYFNDLTFPSLKVCNIDFNTSRIIPVASVVYTAGYTTVPNSVKTAAVMIVEELLKETSGDDNQLRRFTINKITEEYQTPKEEETAIVALGLKNARSILKLLNPYRQSFMRFPFVGPLG